MICCGNEWMAASGSRAKRTDTNYQSGGSPFMPTTHIDTNEIPRAALPGSGEFAEILNNRLCGAKNVVATLHWLGSGEHLDSRSDPNTHQLLYLMEGEAT